MRWSSFDSPRERSSKVISTKNLFCPGCEFLYRELLNVTDIITDNNVGEAFIIRSHIIGFKSSL